MPDSKDKGILAGVAGLITACAALAGLFWGPELTERFLFPSATPTQMIVVSLPLTDTPAPVIDMPVVVSPMDTLARPTETPVPPMRVSSSPVPCNWQAYIDGKVETPSESACLGEVIFGNLGVVDYDDDEIEFVVSNNHAGIYGLVQPLGPVPQLKKGSEFAVKLNIKELTAARFIVAVSPNPRPDVQSAYAIAINPDASQLVTKYFFYKADGIPNHFIFTERPSINTTQGVNYTIKFLISYPNLVIDVNSGSFRPKAEQISFNGVGYLFIGYQRISSETARTRVKAEVGLP